MISGGALAGLAMSAKAAPVLATAGVLVLLLLLLVSRRRRRRRRVREAVDKPAEAAPSTATGPAAETPEEPPGELPVIEPTAVISPGALGAPDPEQDYQVLTGHG